MYKVHKLVEIGQVEKPEELINLLINNPELSYAFDDGVVLTDNLDYVSHEAYIDLGGLVLMNIGVSKTVLELPEKVSE